MTAADFPLAGKGEISRLDAAKQTLSRFIVGRPDDLIGVVAFANYPDLTCPPTVDHEYLLGAVRSLRAARPGDDGTNLGDAIAWSLQALRFAPQRKKVLILLTDGQNEPAVAKPVDPEKAAQLARRMGVTLHTIAIGKTGGIVREREPTTGLEIPAEVKGPDFGLLQRLAELGGGRAYVATDAQTLDEIFRAIDELEKSPVKATIQTRYRDWYPVCIGLALFALWIERFLSGGRLRRLP
jgi:Ca-activated chloride channel family protein